MVCLNGKAYRIISGKDYYAMLHVHPMVHNRCMDPCSQTLDMECMLMIASIVQLLIDALSQNNVSMLSVQAYGRNTWLN